MSVIGSEILAGASGNQGYNIQRSLRFRSSASAYLSRTPASAGNQQTWTWSGWVKRGILGSSVNAVLMDVNSGIAGTPRGYILILGDVLNVAFNTSGSSWDVSLTTSQVLRDPSAWYFVQVSAETTQATASNRLKIYINGSQVTAFSAATYPAQNASLAFNRANAHYIGRSADGINYLDGYLAEVNFIDGQALTPSSFGQTDAVTGVWTPKKYTGTYGTNGFYLPFSDNTSATTLAYDKSGNGNNWTPNNISTTAGATYDSMTDVPTLTSATAANYCVLNPLTSVTATKPTIANGNLTITGPSGSNRGAKGTHQLTYKAYWEVTITASGSGNSAPGIASGTALDTDYTTGPVAVARNNEGNFYVNGTLNPAGSGAPFGAFAAGSIIMLAYDPDTSRLWMGKNGTWFNSGAPASGTGYVTNTSLGSEIYPFCSSYNEQQDVNFGQRPFSYTPPTGFVALNTFNLPDPTIKKGNQYMDATTYTGNGTSISVTNSGSMQPDFVWIKKRSAASNNVLFDAVRGVYKYLISDSTIAEGTDTNSFTAFNSNGFSYGNESSGNTNGATFVGWQWQAGKGSTSSNTSGSITSTVSVNATAGFSVVTYTGTGANATVGHGLGVAPKMVIVKSRNPSGAYDWLVYNANLPSPANGYYLTLNTTNAAIGGASGYEAFWNYTSPTSTTFSIGTTVGANESGKNFVAYCWAEIPGFSKFGSYTGNGSADGPFVYCGFRPKYVMVKRTDTTGGWEVMDAARNTSNQVNYSLSPNFSDAEYSIYAYEDFVSNGFKLRTTDPYWNANGGTYIYAAFAENPFKYANAR